MSDTVRAERPWADRERRTRQQDRFALAALELARAKAWRRRYEGACVGCGRIVGCNCHPDAPAFLSRVQVRWAGAWLFDLEGEWDEARYDAAEVETRRRLRRLGVGRKDVEHFLDAFALCSGVTEQSRVDAAWACAVELGY